MGPVDGRHPATEQVWRWLNPNPALEGRQARVATACAELARVMIAECPDGPELTAGLRKLLEAKDCFVRSSLDGDAEDGVRF